MLSTKQIQKLQKVQNTCLKTIEPGINITESFKKLKILRISQLVKLELNKLAYKRTHNLLPFKQIKKYCTPSYNTLPAITDQK